MCVGASGGSDPAGQPPCIAEDQALAAAAPNGTQACAITNVYIQYSSIPEVDYMKQQFQWWARCWKEIVADGGQELEDLKAAWRIARDEALALPANLRWRRVTSGMSATIAVLLEVGWHPAQPDYFVDTDRQEVAVIGKSDYQDLAIGDAFTLAAERLVWKQAAKHYAGEGLEQGQRLVTSRARAHKRHLKDGKLDAYKCIDRVIAGGAAVGSRFNSKCF